MTYSMTKTVAEGSIAIEESFLMESALKFISIGWMIGLLLILVL